MIRKADKADYQVISQSIKDIDCGKMNKEDPFKHVYVYEKEGNIVGFICYSVIYDRGELDYIYVLENFRKQGIAESLLKFFVSHATKCNCTNITLEVRKSNDAAIKLYEKHGFKSVATRDKYYNGEDGILMIREM